MEGLSLELWELIQDELPPPFAAYAAVSRAWQRFFESRTFASIRVRSTEIEKFDTVFADRRRRALIKELTYTVELPNVSKKRFKKFQGRREGSANNTAYTKAVYELFECLHGWDEAGSSSGLSLDIVAQAAIDDYVPESPYNHTYGEPAWKTRNHNCYIAFDMNAVGSTSLPSAPCVRTLRVTSGRQIHPSFVGVYANALPRVSKMWCDFYPPGRRLASLRRELRTALANTFLHASFECLTHLDLYWEDSDPFNEDFALEDLRDPESNVDLLSIGVRRISQLPRLQELILRGSHVLSLEVFGLSQTAEEEAGNSPLWPSITTLLLDLSGTVPDGGWYFTGDPTAAGESVERTSDPSDESECNYGSSDSNLSHFTPDLAWERLDGNLPSHMFRNQINRETFDPLLLAVVRSASHMPCIRRLGVYFSDFGASVEYLATRKKHHARDEVERRFEEENDMRGRWYIDIHPRGATAAEVNWEVPLDIKRVLRESTGRDGSVALARKGCYYLDV